MPTVLRDSTELIQVLENLQNPYFFLGKGGGGHLLEGGCYSKF